jgi:hypothetical protein
MKITKKSFAAIAIVAAISGGAVIAADHLDSPNVSNQTTDITDVYVFRGQDPNNIVFVGNTQGFLTPASSATAKFDPNTLIEFNIDNNNDRVEDLVIQCRYDAASNKMNVYGPVAPSTPGTKSKVEGAVKASVAVTAYGSNAITSTQNGITLFAGPRDDPFFFDLNQFRAVLGGTATGFNNPGTDTFKGTNVLSVIVEVPKSMLNSTGSINVWLETKKKI